MPPIPRWDRLISSASFWMLSKPASTRYSPTRHPYSSKPDSAPRLRPRTHSWQPRTCGHP
jgi:hypothetical protein